MRSVLYFLCVFIVITLSACLPAGGVTSNAATPQSQTEVNLRLVDQCDLSALTPSAMWQGELENIHLTLTLFNYTDTPCLLVGQANSWVQDSSGFLYSQNQVYTQTTAAEPETFQLEDNGSQGVQVDITWENWCGPTPNEGLHLVVLTQENPGKIDTLIQDPGGQPLMETPACVNQEKKATLHISAFRLIIP